LRYTSSPCGKHREREPLRDILQRAKDRKIAEFKQQQIDKVKKARKSDAGFWVLAEEKERKGHKERL
jgi:hypothetical protein